MLKEGEGRPEVAEQTFGHHSERVGVSDTLWFHASAESVKCLPVASAAALDQRLDKAIPDWSAAPSTLLVIPAATIEVAQHGTMGAVGQGPASCPTN